MSMDGYDSQDYLEDMRRESAPDLGICSNCGGLGPVGKDCPKPRCAENGGSYQ